MLCLINRVLIQIILFYYKKTKIEVQEIHKGIKGTKSTKFMSEREVSFLSQ